jgi:predicted ATP-grasp superfamily ATP-dependent carboligase
MRIYQEITFKTNPTMIASWPGMGNVGIISTDYIRSKISADVLGEIDMSHYFVPDSIIVENGLAELPEIPRAVLYYHTDPDLIIFESNAQISGKDGLSIVKKLIHLAVEYNVHRIFTTAAFAKDVSHNTRPQVYGAFNSEKMLNEFSGSGVEAMPNGYIAGLNGLVLGIASNYDIESACLLGTIPSFATNLSYPKASLEIIRLLETLLGLSTDKKELERSISLVDAQFSEIEDRIRQYYPDAMKEKEEEEDWHDLVEDSEVDHEQEVPRYIMDKIEKLFEEVKKDRSKAPELKKELDRWNLYELYEHRFLDLFKDDNRKDTP